MSYNQLKRQSGGAVLDFARVFEGELLVNSAVVAEERHERYFRFAEMFAGLRRRAP